MNFKKNVNPSGTSLQGYMTATYNELVEVFGQPDWGPDFDDEKVTCEQCLEFEDGTVATIYDYKRGRTPYGQYEWHIGGFNKDAVDRVFSSYNGS